MTIEELETLLDEIRAGRREDASLDLKQKWWDLKYPKSHDEFMKDIAGMANADTRDRKRIVVGVDEQANIHDAPLPTDEAALQEKLKRIAPIPNVAFKSLFLPQERKTISVIEIVSPFDRPYVVQESGERHIVYVRLGSSVRTATRRMLDHWYSERRARPVYTVRAMGQVIAAGSRITVTQPRFVPVGGFAPEDRLFRIRPSLQTDPQEDAELFNRNHRVELTLVNDGVGAGSNLVVDIGIRPAERINVINRPLFIRNPAPPWQTDSSRNCHVDEWTYEPPSYEGRVRQRVKFVNPKTAQALVPFDVTLPASRPEISDRGFDYDINYNVTDMEGNHVAGSVRVQVVFEGERVVEPRSLLGI